MAYSHAPEQWARSAETTVVVAVAGKGWDGRAKRSISDRPKWRFRNFPLVHEDRQVL